MNNRFFRNYEPNLRIYRVDVDRDDLISLQCETCDANDYQLEEIRISLSGGCCSESFFEQSAIQEVKELTGKILWEIRDTSNINTQRPAPTRAMSNENDEARYYAIEIVTPDGVTTLDWRNMSNGYYEGEATLTHTVTLK